MAKAKKPAARGEQRRTHGPKRHQFASYGKSLSMELSRLGLTDKYHDKESWRMSCIDRGFKSVGDATWYEFSKLKDDDAKKAWFEGISKKHGK